MSKANTNQRKVINSFEGATENEAIVKACEFLKEHIENTKDEYQVQKVIYKVLLGLPIVEQEITEVKKKAFDRLKQRG